MGKVFIETVGCPKNLDDSEHMAGLLCAAGHEITFDPSEADIIIVNTCGFIEDAKRESIETIFEYVPYKEDGKRLIVTGCLSQRYPEELAAELPEADAILGVNDYKKLPDIITDFTENPLRFVGGEKDKSTGLRRLKSANEPLRFVGGEKDKSMGFSRLPAFQRKALTPRYSSYLKIAEGCSNNCAYCVIPGIRGPYRSVPVEQLVREAETLAEEGCKELILIAQDVTWYGQDLYGGFALPELLRSILASEAAGGIEWIRLLYCYAERVTDELIEVMKAEPRILKYIDLPLQHVSGKLLKSMRRAGTRKTISDTIGRLRAAMPDIVIRTTFITGLPGETESDFEELYSFAEETRFDRLGVFVYSPEEGTDAAAMPDQVGHATAADRRDELMSLGQNISLEKNERLTGTVQDVIVDGREQDAFIGRTRGDAPEIDDSVIFTAPDSNDDIIGTIVKVRITDALDYDLVGVMFDERQ